MNVQLVSTSMLNVTHPAQANGTPRDRRKWRASRWALAAALVGCVSVGCGGGSGGATAADPAAAPVNPVDPAAPVDPGAVGTVVVTVTDALGAAAPGAGVTVNSRSAAGTVAISAFADAAGVATFDHVPPGSLFVVAYDDSIGYYGSTPDVPDTALPPNGHVDLNVTVHPSAGVSLGIAPAAVAANAISSDGRSFEFTLRAILIGADGGGDVTLADCTVDVTNDSSVPAADCIAGEPGFDASYQAANMGHPLAGRTIAGAAPRDFSAALLLDQSSAFVAKDAWDWRLYDTKYFLLYKRPADRVALAAFASDNHVTGDFSPLPQQPVTIFPAENPLFTAAGTTLFASIDALDSLEGGASPLYASIDRVLDFTATQASASGRRAVVVLTDGHDDTCGSATQCENALRNLIDKSRADDIPIFPIALMSDAEAGRSLSRLAEYTGGVALWADVPQQVGILFAALNGVLGGSAKVYEARFRIDSPTAGAFQSGRAVFGTVQLVSCPWYCSSIAVPFAVRIP